MRITRLILALGVIFTSATGIADDSQVVASDGGIQITYAEFEEALAQTGDKLRALIAEDTDERLEFINGMLSVRKLAAEADDIGPDDAGYWDLQFKLLAAKEKFMFTRRMAEVELPDPEALAREYYRTRKDEYARKPETRASSHILFASVPGLPRGELREKAQRILEELRDGADFEEYVENYSEDKGTAKRGGSLDRWIRLGDPSITPPYSGALFEIEDVGGYSDVTDSQFGLHIIRLDGIREEGYYEYQEVRSKILQDIANEFRRLAAKEVRNRYRITGDVYIDGPAMEELFAPYKQ